MFWDEGCKGFWHEDRSNTLLKDKEWRVQRVWDGERLKVFVPRLVMKVHFLRDEGCKNAVLNTWDGRFYEFGTENGSKVLFKDMG